MLTGCHRWLFSVLLTLGALTARTSTSLAVMPQAPSSSFPSDSGPDSGGGGGGTVDALDRWLVLDFDGTCTTSDTTPLLPRLAALLAGDSDANRDERLAKFHALEREYFDLHQTAKDSIFGGEHHGEEAGLDDGDGDVDKTLTPPPLGLDDALDSLDRVSTHVTHKVSKSRCLAGLWHPPHLPPPPYLASRIADLLDRHPTELGEPASLRSGCASAVATAHRSGWRLGILSINWFPALIEAALMLPVRQHLETEAAAGEMEGRTSAHAEIWSNAIDAEGTITLNVPGASAKRARIAALRKRRREQSLVVFIGDSSTDLTGLLEADVGVMIGDSKTTAAIARRWGVRMAPLFERRSHEGGPSPGSPMDEDTVWIAQSWKEIDRLLHSLQQERC